jgi:hypothetical protein
MKFAFAMLLAASLLQAQTVKPTSLTMTTVPGDFSSSQDLAFVNPGSLPIVVTVSIKGPFTLLKNECENGVRADSHCNVYVTYGATTVGEMDTGSLIFTFNQQSITVPLTGYTVSLIGTSMTATKGKEDILVTILAAGDIIPAGESVSWSCIDEEGANFMAGNDPLKNNKAILPLYIPTEQYQEWWQCGVNYAGDAEFGPTGAGFCLSTGCP